MEKVQVNVNYTLINQIREIAEISMVATDQYKLKGRPDITSS